MNYYGNNGSRGIRGYRGGRGGWGGGGGRGGWGGRGGRGGRGGDNDRHRGFFRRDGIPSDAQRLPRNIDQSRKCNGSWGKCEQQPHQQSGCNSGWIDRGCRGDHFGSGSGIRSGKTQSSGKPYNSGPNYRPQGYAATSGKSEDHACSSRVKRGSEGGDFSKGGNCAEGFQAVTKEHTTCCKTTLKGMTMSERLKKFESLSWEEKLRANGFPPNGVNCNPLPDDLPPEALLEPSLEVQALAQKERLKAAEYAIKETKERFHASCDDDDDDESMSSAESVCDGSPYCDCRDCRSEKRQKMNSDEYDDVFLALTKCLLFDTGFRVRWPRKCDVELCWCPCGSYMKPWQDIFGLTGTEVMVHANLKCGGDGKKKKAPFALLAHLRKQGETCPIHFGVAVYLETLYKNWNGPELAHKDIYKNIDNKKYQEAESAENKRSRRIFDEMQAALSASEERERAMQRKNDEFKLRMEKLDKVNREYRLTVEATETLLDELGLGKEKEAELSEADLGSYRVILENFIEATKAKAKKPSKPIMFDVKNNFSLQELLDELDAGGKDNSFLLRDLTYTGRKDPHFHAPKLVHDWKIKFGDAIDEGGPTKAFFDQVWQQLPALKVGAGNVEVALFPFDEKSSKVVGVLPTTDEYLRLDNIIDPSSDAKKEIRKKAERYYRAIGRIMFHSLIRDFVISSTAMPPFYRNIIFRGCNLRDGRYNHNKVIRDVQATGGNITEQYDKMIGKDLSLYEIETDTPDEKITKENFVSKVVHYFYIKERSIALAALQEGLTLNGYADLLAPLRIMPESAVSKLLFAPSEIDPRDVINVLTPVYSPGEEDIQQGQKHFFENVLKVVLQERSAKDKEFLRSFLSFATGLSFVPHRLAKPNYTLLIEFDMDMTAEKVRPQSKTCANALFLPYHAYNGDRELFESLLDESLLEMQMNNFSDD